MGWDHARYVRVRSSFRGLEQAKTQVIRCPYLGWGVEFYREHEVFDEAKMS